MTDRLLLLHWNELSFPANVSADELQEDPRWAQQAQAALATFRHVLQVRPDCRVSFTKGAFHGHVAGRPLQSWLEIWLGKDHWRRLRARVVQPAAQEQQPIHALECELTCNGQSGEGITRAHIADSWTWSVASEATGSAAHLIRAIKTAIHSNVPVDVDVPNLASEEHSKRWANDLAVWGKALSDSHVVAVLDRYKIIMYPFDHGYPHIHVHTHDDPRLNAKYRVDKFEVMTNGHPVALDALVEPWIDRYQHQLIQSWNRCQAGAFPLKLADE